MVILSLEIICSCLLAAIHKYYRMQQNSHSLPVCLNICLVPAAGNVLVNAEGTQIKVADFGSAQAIQVRKPAHTGGRDIGTLIKDEGNSNDNTKTR